MGVALLVDERWWFASRVREFYGRGTADRYDGPLTPEAVRDALLGLGPHDVLAGWLPFEPGADGSLVRPDRLEVVPHSEAAVVRAAGRTRSLSTRRGYGSAVDDAVRRIRTGELGKVVLARAVDVDGGIDLLSAMRRAREINPEVYAFVYDTAGPTSRASALFGASPELLVRRSGPLVSSVPLAGSAPRDPDPEKDRAAAVALLASEKDRAEHAFVVRHVVEGLEPLCQRVVAPVEPELVATDAMWHLATRIQGVLADAAVSVVDVAVALHPTTAVCGSPRELALPIIRESEGVSRDLYAGAVGWCDASGDGEWAVTLRAGQVVDGTIRLHAGAGVVGDSVGEDEWNETAAKLWTMERALGIEGSAGAVAREHAIAGRDEGRGER
jgi:isochorismate synthase